MVTGLQSCVWSGPMYVWIVNEFSKSMRHEERREKEEQSGSGHQTNPHWKRTNETRTSRRPLNEYWTLRWALDGLSSFQRIHYWMLWRVWVTFSIMAMAGAVGWESWESLQPQINSFQLQIKQKWQRWPSFRSPALPAVEKPPREQLLVPGG